MWLIKNNSILSSTLRYTPACLAWHRDDQKPWDLVTPQRADSQSRGPPQPRHPKCLGLRPALRVALPKLKTTETQEIGLTLLGLYPIPPGDGLTLSGTYPFQLEQLLCSNLPNHQKKLKKKATTYPGFPIIRSNHSLDENSRHLPINPHYPGTKAGFPHH